MKNLTVKQHAWVALGILAGSLLVILIGVCLSNPPEINFLVWLGLGLSLAASGYSWKFVRCPHCGERPYTRYVPEFCPHCGKKMND